MDKQKLIRTIYLYLVSAITIVILLISSIGLINLVLNEYVLDVQSWSEIDSKFACNDEFRYTAQPTGEELTGEELTECEADQKERAEIRHVNDLKRDLATFLSMLLVAFPLYLYHWGIIKKENRK
jgi:hypothetical protein